MSWHTCDYPGSNWHDTFYKQCFNLKANVTALCVLSSNYLCYVPHRCVCNNTKIDFVITACQKLSMGLNNYHSPFLRLNVGLLNVNETGPGAYSEDMMWCSPPDNLRRHKAQHYLYSPEGHCYEISLPEEMLVPWNKALYAILNYQSCRAISASKCDFWLKK